MLTKTRHIWAYIQAHYNTRSNEIKVFYLASLIGFVGWGVLHCFNFFKFEYQRFAFSSFPNGVYGIFVAPFSDETEKLRIQKSIFIGLTDNFRNLNINNVEVRSIPEILYNPFSNHNEARTFGEKYNAQIVVWGDVVVSGVKPRLTIVKPRSEATVLVNQDTDILKDTLATKSLESIDDIDFPPLIVEPTSVVLFVTGLRYFHGGQYQKAIDYFKKSIPKEDNAYLDMSAIYFYLGDAYFLVDEFAKAIFYYTKELEVGKIKHHETYSNRGLTYKMLGKYKEAMIDFNAAIEINSKDWIVFNNRGNLHVVLGEYQDAIRDFNKALEFEPELAQLYLNRGRARWLNDEFELAIEDYNKVIAISPNNAEVYNNLGTLYFDLRRFDESIEFYKIAINKNPEYGNCYANLGNVYLTRRAYKLAVDSFNIALQKKTTRPDIYYLRALALEGLNRPNDAIRDFGFFVDHAPQEYANQIVIALDRIKYLSNKNKETLPKNGVGQ